MIIVWLIYSTGMRACQLNTFLILAKIKRVLNPSNVANPSRLIDIVSLEAVGLSINGMLPDAHFQRL